MAPLLSCHTSLEGQTAAAAAAAAAAVAGVQNLGGWMFGTADHGRTLDCFQIKLLPASQQAMRWHWWLAAASTEARNEVWQAGVKFGASR
jgi:hypothetical protein